MPTRLIISAVSVASESRSRAPFALRYSLLFPVNRGVTRVLMSNRSENAATRRQAERIENDRSSKRTSSVRDSVRSRLVNNSRLRAARFVHQPRKWHIMKGLAVLGRCTLYMNERERETSLSLSLCRIKFSAWNFRQTFSTADDI